ncbi:MAG: helix-turn-helix domain-containing protein, partial [Patescibacteria group bacterium]|nr:helix-turn-helix domain-containing protein [Patescibacteria group bacterium]
MQKRNFVRKKVKSLTLGEKLRQLRGSRDMSAQKLSRHINVKVLYIEALEHGQYDKLPTKVYAKGFVRSYARFFRVSEKTFLELFDREYSIYQNINKKDDEEEMNKLPKIPRFVFTPQIVIVAGALVVLCAVGFYLYFSIDNFVSSPWLTIEEPIQNSITDSETIVVRGATRDDSRVFINGQQIFVDMNGVFSDTIKLVPGVNVINVKSVNKFEKESVEEIFVDAQYEVKEEKQDTINVHIVVKAQNNPVWINVIADDIDIYNDTLQLDDEIAFDGVNQIVITTSSGTNTLVSEDDGETFGSISE